MTHCFDIVPNQPAIRQTAIPQRTCHGHGLRPIGISLATLIADFFVGKSRRPGIGSLRTGANRESPAFRHRLGRRLEIIPAIRNFGPPNRSELRCFPHSLLQPPICRRRYHLRIPQHDRITPVLNPRQIQNRLRNVRCQQQVHDLGSPHRICGRAGRSRNEFPGCISRGFRREISRKLCNR
jgi:hypothetical protein